MNGFEGDRPKNTLQEIETISIPRRPDWTRMSDKPKDSLQEIETDNLEGS